MPLIFPGMDPYLENPLVWPGVHSRFIVYLAEQLQLLLLPRYVASVEERVYMEGPRRDVIPDVGVRRSRSQAPAAAPVAAPVAVADVAKPVRVRVPPLQVRETFVAIYHRETQRRLVTVIEVVSPTNKFAGPGRASYVAKQQEVLGSTTHLVEIDLLRVGPHVLAVPEHAAAACQPYDYLVCMNRAEGIRQDYDLVPLSLRQRLPKIPVPLSGDDPDVYLDLQAVLERVYNVGAYEGEVDYAAPCVPRLSAEDEQWANDLIRKARTQSGSGTSPG